MLNCSVDDGDDDGGGMTGMLGMMTMVVVGTKLQVMEHLLCATLDPYQVVHAES